MRSSISCRTLIIAQASSDEGLTNAPVLVSTRRALRRARSIPDHGRPGTLPRHHPIAMQPWPRPSVSTSAGAVGSHVRSQVWRPLHLPVATGADVVVAGAQDRKQTEAAEGESICGCGSLTCRGLPAQRCMIGGLAIRLLVIYAAFATHLRNLAGRQDVVCKKTRGCRRRHDSVEPALPDHGAAVRHRRDQLP